MLTLPLEPTDDQANPAFKDVASCAAWLNQLQLTNLHQAHSVLRGQMDELNRFPMRGLERLHVLESLRETISAVQGDYARKLILKKLPLSDDELTIFVAITSLWQSMVNGYQRCLQAYLAGDKQLSGEAALLCQRCLEYTGLQIFEHLRTGYEFDPALWQRLHALYAFAEEQGFQRAPVADVPQPISCETIYVKTLLACQAKPAELTRTQLQLMDRWLARWNDALHLEQSVSMSKEDAPPLAVDLASTHGLQSLNHVSKSESVRYLAMVPLSKLLRVKSLLLQQGQTPQQLELGSECGSADCIDFLQRLHRNWCEPVHDRLAERHPVAQAAELCAGIEAIYAHIARKPFKKPGKEAGVDSMARKQIAAFGRVLSDTNRFDLSQLGFALESWQIENESILGARVLREANAGGRIGVHQIVGLRPGDASAFIIGKINWAQVTRSGHLRMGIGYLPGVAQAMVIRGKSINPSVAEKSAAALLLPEMPALKIPASLILPRDFFQPSKLVEATGLDDITRTLKLGFSVDKGIDFERVSFSEVSQTAG